MNLTSPTGQEGWSWPLTLAKTQVLVLAKECWLQAHEFPALGAEHHLVGATAWGQGGSHTAGLWGIPAQRQLTQPSSTLWLEDCPLSHHCPYKEASPCIWGRGPGPRSTVTLDLDTDLVLDGTLGIRTITALVGLTSYLRTFRAPVPHLKDTQTTGCSLRELLCLKGPGPKHGTGVNRAK